MSLASALIPAEAAIASGLSIARPLLGLGLLAAVLVFFKPLLAGMLRAVVLAFQPRTANEQARRRLDDVVTLYRMARESDSVHPSLAAELRAIAARA